MDLTIAPQTDSIKIENEKLLEHNRELRKMLLLLHENVYLRRTLEYLSDNPDDIQRRIINFKLDGEDADSDPEKSKTSKDHKQFQNGASGSGVNQGTDSFPLRLMQHIIGEIAFQLDRRILMHIFPNQTKLYGISVANIPQKIVEAATDFATGNVDEMKQTDMMQRYDGIMKTLKPYGYDIDIHPTFSESLVNAFGIIKEYPPADSTEMQRLCDPENLKKIAHRAVPSTDLENILILLKCLSTLSKGDGKPLFLL
ncbi:speriolin-like protein isoform X2 [Engystomops pustulosus]|uniref:speriolin-like protein isoform X2 n=1 Tax=Engystomops pustulosus TaxID=76066 RepID=UPI003AFB53BD